MKKKKVILPVLFSLFCSALFLFSLQDEESGGEQKITAALSAQMQEKGAGGSCEIWIYFRDKGPRIREKLAEAERSLNFRSIRRRLRRPGNPGLVDYYDLPVQRSYLTRIRPLLRKLRHKSRWLNAVSASVSVEHISAAAAFPFVEKLDIIRSFIYRDPVNPQIPSPIAPPARVHTFDYGPSFSQVDQIEVPPLHDRGFSGKGVLICMLDSGFNNLDHQALRPLDIQAAWDFVNGDPDVRDETNDMGVGNHGTNTLGAIAGFYPGKLVGPAFGASFILGKTENTEWERHIEEDHWVAGAEWADELGADIISSSLGYRDRFTHGETNYTSEDMDGETAIVTRGANIAAGRGILVVNSAGNEGRNPQLDNTIIAPADSPYVLAAAAVNPRGNIAPFSSYGPSADGRIKPDAAAPGVNVYTAGDQADDSYVSVDGTSFSCPLAAGAAALLLEINPSWSNRDIMAAMKNTASRASNPDNRFGWGILNTEKASRYRVKNIHPPREFSMKRAENDYIFFRQYVDRLSWEPNPRNQGQASVYRIFARKLGDLSAGFEWIAELDASVYFYERRGLLKDEEFLYKIITVSRTGEASDPYFTRQRNP